MTRSPLRGLKGWSQQKRKTQMSRNEGTIDRALRGILGRVLIVMAARGRYTPGSMHALVDKRLTEYARKNKTFGQ